MTEIVELVARALADANRIQNFPGYEALAQAAIKAMEDAGYVKLPIDLGFVSVGDMTFTVLDEYGKPVKPPEPPKPLNIRKIYPDD